MHVDGFVRGKGKFVVTEYVPTDEKTGPRFPLLLTTGRILSQYNVGAQTRRTGNIVWHEEDLLEIHPTDAENRGLKDGDCAAPCQPHGRDDAARAWSPTASRRAWSTPPSTTPTTQANVVTTDYSDWATNCPEYKVTAVQVMPSNGPTEWQEEYAELTERARRIAARRWSRPNERTIDAQLRRMADQIAKNFAAIGHEQRSARDGRPHRQVLGSADEGGDLRRRAAASFRRSPRGDRTA